MKKATRQHDVEWLKRLIEIEKSIASLAGNAKVLMLAAQNVINNPLQHEENEVRWRTIDRLLERQQCELNQVTEINNQ